MTTYATGPSTENRAISRLEDERFLRGEGRYVGDLRIPGMLHLSVVRSPYPFGALRGVDLEAVRAHPGVVDAFAADEVADLLAVIPSRLPIPDSLEPYLQLPLARGEVRYVGQPVAVVVATSPEAALDAADLAVVDVEPASLPETDVLHENALAFGELDAAFAEAAVIVRETFTIGRQAGLPLEARAVLADFDPEAGELTVWTAAKAPQHMRATIARTLGLAPAQVRLNLADTGGGFGVRGELHPEDLLVPIAAYRNRRPVRWLEERLEHLQSAYQSRDQRWEAALAVAADGTITALEGAFRADVGAFVGPNGLTPGRVGQRAFLGPYRIPAYRCHASYVRSCKPPVGTMRGPGYFESGFVRERLLDLAAAELGLDPVELRRRNLVRPDEMPWDTGVPHLSYDGGEYETALDRALEALDGGDGGKDGDLTGFGVACVVEGTGTPGTETAWARLEANGRISIGVGSSSFGQGHATTFAQVAARALGVEPEEIDIAVGDLSGPDGSGGTFASRSAVMVGSACHEAALELRRAILARAEETLGGQAAIVDGRLELAGDPRTSAELSELAPLEVQSAFTNTAAAFAYGSFAARAAVDPETGSVKLLELAFAVDAGFAINPEVVRGQLIGGAVQGLGGALFEELDFGENGEPHTGGLRDYHLPLAADIPPMTAVVLELVPSPRNPLGVRGMGEIATAGAAAAIANAVADAIGKAGGTVTALPITPSRLVFRRAS